MTDWNHAGFLAVGGQPALDLLNTVFTGADGPVDMLTDTAALERWFLSFGLIQSAPLKTALHRWRLTEDAAKFMSDLLVFRQDLRAAILRVEAGQTPGVEFVSKLNELLAAHPMRRAVVIRQGKVQEDQAFTSSVEDNLWAIVCSHTAALLLKTPTNRLRQCESCVVHFYDGSKKSGRRWCSMTLCGNKRKVAAYKRRQRPATAAATA